MNLVTVLQWIFAILFFVALLIHIKRLFPSNLSTRQLAYDATFLAIILLMGFVPQMGYITILPGLSLTLLPIPVILGSYLFKNKRGWLYGLFFGLTSWIVALMNPVGFNAFFIYPWISLLPRLLFGLVSGFLFNILGKNPKMSRNAFLIGVTSFLLCGLHTLLVFGDLFIFYKDNILQLFLAKDILVEGLKLTFLGVILLGALGEMILSGLLVPLIAKSIIRFQEKKGK